MNRTPVQSSNLASVGHDADDGILEVEFNNGRVYEYFRVPESIFRGLLGAPSPGQYFADHVKDQYRFRRVQ